jgi:hypothetical protein
LLMFRRPPEAFSGVGDTKELIGAYSELEPTSDALQ